MCPIVKFYFIPELLILSERGVINPIRPGSRLPIVRAKMDSVSNIIQRVVARQITYTSFIRGYGLGR